MRHKRILSRAVGGAFAQAVPAYVAVERLNQFRTAHVHWFRLQAFQVANGYGHRTTNKRFSLVILSTSARFTDA